MYHVPGVPRDTSVTSGTSAPSGTWYTNVNFKTKGKNENDYQARSKRQDDK